MAITARSPPSRTATRAASGSSNTNQRDGSRLMPQNPRSDHPADVAILTILPEAYEAVMRIFGLSTFENREGYQWTTGTIGNGGDELLIVLGQPLDRENVPAATFTQTMIQGWRPRYFLLVDIGGGVTGLDAVNLGDVVTHT